MRLYNGDCLIEMDKIKSHTVDMILCDLPYGTTSCKWDNIISFELLWNQYNRVAKKNTAVVLFSAQPFTTKLIKSNEKQYRYNWYWKKNNVTGFTYAKYQPMRCIEDICVFYKAMPTYNPQGILKLKKPIKKKGVTCGIYDQATLNNPHEQKYTNYPRHLLEFNGVPSNTRIHPTQKPVELLEYLIKTYTNAGDVVLDNCMGSGSSGIACKNTNREFIGIEQDKEYYEIAKSRIYTQS